MRFTRVIRFLALWAVLSAAAGCAIMGCRTTAGHQFKKGEIEFLDLPGIPRDEVVATLGKPLWESQTNRVLLYYWRRTFHYPMLVPDINDNYPNYETEWRREKDGKWEQGLENTESLIVERPTICEGQSKDWVLFIGFGEDMMVTTHQTRQQHLENPEEMCRKWREGLTKAGKR